MKRVIRRPSPAMVVAIVALIAALGGTAIGAAFVTKKKAKKIAANQVNKLAPGLSVASAKTADTASNLADQSQQIRAWAQVDSNGAVLASKNVNSVVQDGDGRYCFDLPFTPNAAVASLDATAANLNQTLLTQVNDTSLCPAPNGDVRVYTGTPGGDSTVNQGFFIHIN